VLNIAIPMAGLGSRFAEAGYDPPKPLIPIHGHPMIRWVIKNLTPSVQHRFIFMAQREHVLKHQLEPKLRKWAPGCEIVQVDGLTDGAARTVLLASEMIDNDEPLLIANSDQWINLDIDQFLEKVLTKTVDGTIMTMKSNDPKWSYVELDGSSFVTRLAEKEVISNTATVGVYAFLRGADFVNAAIEMIGAGDRVNGEFYVAPAYNWMIKRAKRIDTFDVGSESDGMFGLGIPSDLEFFREHPISQKVWFN